MIFKRGIHGHFFNIVLIKQVDIGDREHNHTTELAARMKVPLKGANKKGFLHSWCTRPELGAEWEVNKLDLEVEGHTWTFFINPNAKDKYSVTKQTDKAENTSTQPITDEEASTQPITGQDTYTPPITAIDESPPTILLSEPETSSSDSSEFKYI